MKQVEKITLRELREMAGNMYGNLIRPRQNNRSRDVEDPRIRRAIRAIVSEKVKS